MAPKKSRKVVQETMVEEPTQDPDVPPQAMGEEEHKDSEGEQNHDSHEDHESEEEQPNAVLFTPEQLEVLLKMNRPDYNELVAALKGGSSKGVGFKPARPGNFEGARDRKVVDAWLAEMEDYLHAAKVGLGKKKGRPMVTHGNSLRNILSWNSFPGIPTTFQGANSVTW
jgi:hypothetical protein